MAMNIGGNRGNKLCIGCNIYAIASIWLWTSLMEQITPFKISILLWRHDFQQPITMFPQESEYLSRIRNDNLHVTGYRVLVVFVLDVLWYEWISLIIQVQTSLTSPIHLNLFSIKTSFFSITFCYSFLIVVVDIYKGIPGRVCQHSMFMFCHVKPDHSFCLPLKTYVAICICTTSDVTWPPFCFQEELANIIQDVIRTMTLLIQT